MRNRLSCLAAIGAVGLLALGIVAPAQAAHDASGAEYAIRWNPAEGGPRDAKEVAAALQLGKGQRKSYEVRFFAVRQPADLAAGSAAIVRQRSAKHAVETMYKLRSTTPFTSADLMADWQCPLPASAAPNRKQEVDVGWTADGPPRKTFSLSCEAEGAVADLLPASFSARPLDCSSQVRRTEIDDLKIEQWQLPSGQVALEVSWEGQDSAADFALFERRVVQPLAAHGVKAEAESKTEMGSGC